jgi:hypothetical protein
MTKCASFKLSLALGICLFLCACGGGVPVREDVPPGFQSGTHIIGEVVKLYTRNQVLKNELPKFTSDLKSDLLATGISESDIVDGSEVGVFTYCYAHNSSVSCLEHMGYYMAHASPELRDQIKLGSVVEVDVSLNKKNRLMGSIVRVYGAIDDPAVGCSLKKLNYKGLATFSPLGAPVGAWYDCKGMEKDEWVRRCVRGAPPTGPLGEKTCVFELQKPPLNR